MSVHVENPDDLVGAVLNNKYQVQKRLSQGGMGVVYQARHVVLDTSVALKVLLQSDDKTAQERFLSEARLASKVRHPNTVYIADFGVLPDGRAFLEMEFIDGRTLSKELEKGALDVLRACQIAMQIARGLQAVHEKGIIHRDMKPDNVFLLEQDGTSDFVKIVDFGIAKTARTDTPKTGHGAISRQSSPDANASSPLEAAAGLEGQAKPGAYTMPGSVMGTPGFMAPEQIQGFKLDVRVDQYALGCMLYEMIAGQPVIAGHSLTAVMMKHLTVNPSPLRERVPKAGVSESLDGLVLRLLAKDPRKRFGSMREVESALQSIIDRLLVARGQKPASAVWKTPLKLGQIRLGGRRVPLWLWAPLVIATIGGLSYGGYRLTNRFHAGDDRREMTSTELLALQQRALAVILEDARDSQPELRASAIAALGQTHDAEQRTQLQTAIGSSNLETRIEAAAALGALGDRQATPILATILEQSGAANPPSLKIAAADALRQLGDSRGQRFLEQLLTSGDADTQFRAALLFCEKGPPDAQRVLRAASQRSGLPPSVLLPALSCLSRAGDATALDRLRSQVSEVGPRELRMTAAAKLAQAGDAEGLKYLREVAKKAGREQIIAARELALLDEPEGLELFRKVLPLTSAQSIVRQLAADGLGAVGEPIDARGLSSLLPERGDRMLRQAGARAILEIAGRDPGLLSAQSVSWARTALAGNDTLVRQTAVAILGDSQGANTLPLFAGLLADRDAKVRRSALRALERKPDNQQALRSFPPLREALQSLLDKGTPQERVLSASLLARQGDAGPLKRLRDFLTAPDAELRRLALEQLTLPASELLPLLRDSALAVRFVAARKLAELKDTRGAAVLREAVAAGGADAISAYGLLKRLGLAQEVPDSAMTLLSDPEAANRSAAVEALAVIPWPQAEPYLKRAAHDREADVRQTTAEVSAEFAQSPNGPEPLRLLRRLSEDSDASVRTRASALLARTSQSAAAADDSQEPAASKSANKIGAEVNPPPDHADSAETPTPNPASGGMGQLIVEAAPGVQFALDRRPLQAASEKPLVVEAGPHTLNFLSGQRAVDVIAGQTTRVTIPTSQIEQLAKSGLDSFHAADWKKAQRQMEKAIGLCSRDRTHAALCATLTFELSCRLGQIHEQQKEWPQAMTEYQRVLALSTQVRGKSELKSSAQEAVQRLQQRLGQVIVEKRGKRGCQQESMWLPPGTHMIKTDKKFESVEVESRQVVHVGSCK